MFLLERNVALSLDEGRIPRDTISGLGQLRVELGVCGTVQSHTLHLAVGMALISVDETAKRLASLHHDGSTVNTYR